jgi:hypothetical protein
MQHNPLKFKPPYETTLEHEDNKRNWKVEIELKLWLSLGVWCGRVWAKQSASNFILIITHQMSFFFHSFMTS